MDPSAPDTIDWKWLLVIIRLEEAFYGLVTIYRCVLEMPAWRNYKELPIRTARGMERMFEG